MKQRRIFGLAVIATALTALALAASASAATVTDSSGNGTPAIHLVSVEGPVPGTKHVVLHLDPGDVECNATFQGTVTSHGSGVTVSGHNSSFFLTGCTGGWSVEVNSKGRFVIHNISTIGHGSGQITWTETTVTAKLFGGLVTCRYKTEETNIGTFTGGNPAQLHVEAAIPFHGGSGLCGGETALLTGAWKSSSTLQFHA